MSEGGGRGFVSYTVILNPRPGNLQEFARQVIPNTCCFKSGLGATFCFLTDSRKQPCLCRDTPRLAEFPHQPSAGCCAVSFAAKGAESRFKPIS